MKIKSLELIDNKKIGNIKLDFTQNGIIQDTIILAGNNGCGKTTILEELSIITRKRAWLYNNRNIGKIIVNCILENEECAEIISSLSEKADEYLNISDMIKNLKQFNEMEIIIDFEKRIGNDGRMEINLLNDSLKINLNTYLMLDVGNLENIISSFYSTANINYNLSNISNITTNDLDKKDSNSIVTENDIGTIIKQTFIDINNLDAQEFQKWMSSNINELDKTKIEENMNIRMKRFENAFNYIINDLKFDEIVNSENFKEVIFDRNGKKIRIDDFSTGEKQIMIRGGYLLKFLNALKNNIILIDEPELSLHPEWQKKILQFYKKLFTDENGKQTSQIFVATHSPFIIHNSSRYNDKVIVLNRNSKDGKVEVVENPKYYDCSNLSLIKDAFNINEFQQSNNILFTEGETDKKYLEKAIELYFPNGVKFKVEWIGKYNSNGKAINTGDTGLNNLLRVLEANEEMITNKIGLLYDCDTNKPSIIEDKYFTYTLNEIPGKTYQIGIENNLELPDDFAYEEYASKREKIDKYGLKSTNVELNKVKLCDFICSSPNVKDYLKNLQHILKEINDIMEK